MRSALLVLVLLGSSGALAQRNPELEKAQLLLAQKKYGPALKSLDAAAKKGGLERESMLTLLESRALAQAWLGQTEQAEADFRSVLQLDARRELAGKYTGKPAAVIASALEWFKANGTIEVGPLEPGAEDGRLKQISLFVKNDPLKLVRQVRFYIRADGGAWKPQDAQLINGAAATDVDSAAVEWWAELQTEKKDQLLFLGSAGRPIKQAPPAPVAVVKKADAPVAAAPAKLTPVEKPVEKVATVSTSGSALRPVGYVLLGLGVVAVGVGSYFGITANGLRDGVRADLAKGGVDPVDLYNRDQQAISSSTVANILFVGAGALGLSGGLLWFLGRDVTVVPGAGGGVTVLGKF